MIDITSQYAKKQKRKALFSLILSAFIFAVWINIALTKNDVAENLKASIIEVWEKNQDADLYLNVQDSKNEIISINSSKNIKELSHLSLSLVYNPESIEIKDIFDSKNNKTISFHSEVEGITSIIMEPSELYQIKKWESILKIVVDKKDTNEEKINLINAIFKDEKDWIFVLSTSWINIK